MFGVRAMCYWMLHNPKESYSSPYVRGNSMVVFTTFYFKDQENMECVKKQSNFFIQLCIKDIFFKVTEMLKK